MMTSRQVECLAWLRRVGKVTPKAAAERGFQQRTLNALVREGMATRRHISGDLGRPVPVWEPTERPPDLMAALRASLSLSQSGRS